MKCNLLEYYYFTFLFNQSICSGYHSMLIWVCRFPQENTLEIAGTRFFLQAGCLSYHPTNSVTVKRTEELVEQ